MNEEEIKNKLTQEEYHVLREKGTEAPFSGSLLNEKRDGMYSCKVCGSQLFSSGTKFDSGSGWPSFDNALPNAVKYINDNSLGVNRVEVVCANCGSHLGHVFDDGPTKTGKRFCMNSVCLEFKEDENKN
jgi:peptide-methionine (R)-S-oxide reductase